MALDKNLPMLMWIIAPFALPMAIQHGMKNVEVLGEFITYSPLDRAETIEIAWRCQNSHEYPFCRFLLANIGKIPGMRRRPLPMQKSIRIIELRVATKVGTMSIDLCLV